MNRKAYFNDKFIEFVEGDMQSSHNQAIKIYNLSSTDKNTLKKIIEDFLDETKSHSVRINIQNFESALKDLKTLFYYIEAAGGLIEKDNEYLFIYRHGRWDLPKGKLEKGETIEVAAVRECEEECGVKNLEIIHPLSSTFHIYRYKDGFAFKQSYWFYMRTSYSKKLKPQTEEDISEVRWFTKKEIESVILKDTYYTICDVTREGIKL